MRTRFYLLNKHFLREVDDMTLMLVYFVIALGLAIGAGRMSTIVMDAMRVDFTTEMDDSHELNSETQKSTAM